MMRARLRAARERHPRAFRAFVGLVVTLFALELLYVIGANAVLASHVIDDQINASTKDVELHMPRAWTFWPGRVHVRDFSFRVNDGNVQALLTIPRAFARVDLLPLLKKRVVLRGAEAHGARYWMRHRVSAITAANRAQIDAYPPIPGAEPPLFDPARLSQPPPPPEVLWQVELHDGEADGEEIWIQEFRYRGAYHGTGTFLFAPLQWFELGPTEGHLAAGSLDIGEHRVTGDLHADLALSMARFEVPKVLGLDPLRGLDAHVALGAQIPQGDWLAVYRPLGVPLQALQAASLEADLEFRDRHFTEQTRATLQAGHLSATEGGVRIAGGLLFALKGQAGGHLGVRADADDLTLTLTAAPAMSKQPWHLRQTSTELDVYAELDHPPTLALHMLRTTLTIPNLEWVSPLTHGAWTASGQMDTTVIARRDAKGILSGTFDSKLGETRLTGKSLALAFAGSNKGQFSTKDPAKSVQFTQISLDLPIFTLRSGGAQRTSKLHARVPSMTLTTAPDLQLQGNADVEVADSGVLLVPVDAQGGLASLAARWLSNGPAALHAAFVVSPNGPALTLDPSRVGQADVRGFLNTVNDAPFGAFVVTALGIDNGVRIDAGGATVVPLAGASWLAEQRGKAR